MSDDVVPKDAATTTRARFLEAARELFLTKEYSEISVDMIARKANFKRATFYLHFAGKDDILASAMIAISRGRDETMRWFERTPPSPKSIEAFLRNSLNWTRKDKSVRLFHLAAMQSPVAREAFHQNRVRLMGVLSEGFPAFRQPADRSAGELRRWGTALLLLLEIEQLGLRQDEIGDPEVVEQMMLALRDQLVEFNRRYPRRRGVTPTGADEA